MSLELKDGLARGLISAFNSLTSLMKSPVGDKGAVANAKQAALGLEGFHPDVVEAYHESLIAAVLVQPIPVIPVVEPLVSPDNMKKSEVAYKEKLAEKKENLARYQEGNPSDITSHTLGEGIEAPPGENLSEGEIKDVTPVEVVDPNYPEVNKGGARMA